MEIGKIEMERWSNGGRGKKRAHLFLALRVEREGDVIGVQHLERALLQLDDLDPPTLVSLEG